MSTFQQLREGLRQALDSVSEGWQRLYHKASDAMTRFTGDEKGNAKDDTQNSNELAFRNAGWAMLAAEVFEDEHNLIVRLEMPGLAKEHIGIEVRDNFLIVNGEKKVERERTLGTYHITECAYGSFERAIPLPGGVDTKKAYANYSNGILRIELPKTEDAVRNRITVNIK